MQRLISAFILVLLVCVTILVAQASVEKLDYPTIAKIRDEGLNRSQVMDHIGWLSDVYGPWHDMMQQATIIAVFAYNAAARTEKLPRKPLPTVK